MKAAPQESGRFLIAGRNYSARYYKHLAPLPNVFLVRPPKRAHLFPESTLCVKHGTNFVLLPLCLAPPPHCTLPSSGSLHGSLSGRRNHAALDKVRPPARLEHAHEGVAPDLDGAPAGGVEDVAVRHTVIHLCGLVGAPRRGGRSPAARAAARSPRSALARRPLLLPQLLPQEGLGVLVLKGRELLLLTTCEEKAVRD